MQHYSCKIFHIKLIHETKTFLCILECIYTRTYTRTHTRRHNILVWRYYWPVSASKLTVAWNLFPALSTSRVSWTSELCLREWILLRACSRLIQKLISCRTVPLEASLSSRVTYTKWGKEATNVRKNIYIIIIYTCMHIHVETCARWNCIVTWHAKVTLGVTQL